MYPLPDTMSGVSPASRGPVEWANTLPNPELESGREKVATCARCHPWQGHASDTGSTLRSGH